MKNLKTLLRNKKQIKEQKQHSQHGFLLGHTTTYVNVFMHTESQIGTLIKK